ncbi:MAG: putative bifunctional diguanylate cyclase/phosphodiesterase [Microthrixaceae bacterium]
MSASASSLVVALLDHLEDPAWLAETGTGAIVAANAAAWALCPQATEGTSVCDLLEPRLDAERWAHLCERLDDGGHPLASHVRSGEQSVPVQLSLSRHLLDGRTVVLVVGSRVRPAPPAAPGADATDWAVVADTLDEGVALVDAGGRITSVNAAFCRLVGRQERQLLDRTVHDPPWDLVLEDGASPDPRTSAPVGALRTARSCDGPLLTPRHVRGERPWFRMAAHPLPSDEPGTTAGAVLVLSDETPGRAAAAEVDRLLGADPLTGLASRSRIVQIVGSLTQDVRGAVSAVRVGVLHVDVDAFRSINESFGTATGDAILVQVAGRLRDLGERRVEIGRIGVDEFLVVHQADGASLAFDARLRRLAEEIQRRLSEPFQVDGLEVRLTASVGVARSPGDASTADELLAAAGRALMASRSDAHHAVEFHRGAGGSGHHGHAVEHDLRTAIAQRDLDVHYQPLFDLRTGEIAAAEALLRWHHPLRGPVPPSVFIPAAESSGSIVAIGDLVLTTVARDLRRWIDTGTLPPDVRVAVNVSATEFEHPQYVERLSRVLSEAGVPPQRLELEITESLLVQDLRSAARRLAELDELGFLIALDDFGTGYSSLSYLHSLPLHALKIDRQFVSDLRDGRSGTITRTIVSMAHHLGIIAIAEGVETEAQRDVLAQAGCDVVQGFLYAPPLPTAAFERLVERRTRPDGAQVPVAAGTP